MKGLIQDIIASLETLQNPKRSAFAVNYYPTSLRVIGVTVPHVKRVAKEVKASTKHFSASEKWQLCMELNQTNIFECQQLGFELIGSDRKLKSAFTEAQIKALAFNLDNWISVDTFAVLILGFAWRIGSVSDPLIYTYLKSDSIWLRRLALVATVALNTKAHGGYGDSLKTLSICEYFVTEKSPNLVKALSWALRSLAVHCPNDVEQFLDQYQAQLHSRVLREVRHKLTEGTKN